MENQIKAEKLDFENISIKLIAAISENHCIGKNGKLPWNIPGELKMFASLTAGKIIVVGRKTYETLPYLRDREIIVVGRNVIKTNANPSITVATSKMEVLRIAAKLQAKEIWVIGGREIYLSFLPNASEIYLSTIKGSFYGDTFLGEVAHEVLKAYDKLKISPVEDDDDFITYKYSMVSTPVLESDDARRFKRFIRYENRYLETMDNIKKNDLSKPCCNTIESFLAGYDLGVVEGRLYWEDFHNDNPDLQKILEDERERDELKLIGVRYTNQALICTCKRGNFAFNSGHRVGYQKSLLKHARNNLPKS